MEIVPEHICVKIVNFRLDRKTMLITVSVRCI